MTTLLTDNLHLREDIQILDSGNRYVKTMRLNSKRDKFAFIHAIQPISKAEYKNDTTRGNDDDLYIIDGQFYRAGYRASAHTNALRGAQRYNTADYHRALIGIAANEMFPDDERNIILFHGHAPQDISYRDTMRDNVRKQIKIEHKGNKKTLGFDKIEFWDEPLGGVMNKILTDGGYQTQNNKYASGSSITFDLGGYTTDVSIVEENKVRTDELDSFTEVNLINVERDFFYSLRNDSVTRDIFVNAEHHKIAPKLREALRTGVYDAGGYGALNVSHMVDEVLYPLVNFVVQAYNIRGGTERFHAVFLTGGGAAIVEVYVRKALINQGRVKGHGIYLAGTLENAIYTNLLGAGKLACFYSRKGRM